MEVTTYEAVIEYWQVRLPDDARITDRSNDEVLEQANLIGAPLVASDKDFGELVNRHGRTSHGAILVRLAGITNERKSEIVSEAVASHASEFERAFAVVSSGQIRTRRGR